MSHNPKNNLFKEDVSFLDSWLQQAVEMATKIATKSKTNKSISIFTISSTRKLPLDNRPYLTPIRRTVHGYIGGSVVFSQTQVLLLVKKIDGIVDHILVDAEKKIGITLGIKKSIMKKYNLKLPKFEDKSRQHIEMGNLSSVCANEIKKSRFYEYKPNDITVEAVWHLLSNKFKTLSGRNIAIIGVGNIGFKLALKLVESGSYVEIVRRDINRGLLMSNVINVVKPKDTIATANYNPSALRASLFTDAIIGSTNGVPVITWEMIQSMKPKGMVIDIGKGSIEKDALEKAVFENIPIYRCDISSAIDGVISTIERNRQIIENEYGRKEIDDNLFVVSGGMIGKKGDFVVDNYRNPNQIYGIADGAGDLNQNYSKKQKQQLNKLQNFLIHKY